MLSEYEVRRDFHYSHTKGNPEDLGQLATFERLSVRRHRNHGELYKRYRKETDISHQPGRDFNDDSLARNRFNILLSQIQPIPPQPRRMKNRK